MSTRSVPSINLCTAPRPSHDLSPGLPPRSHLREQTVGSTATLLMRDLGMEAENQQNYCPREEWHCQNSPVRKPALPFAPPFPSFSCAQSGSTSIPLLLICSEWQGYHHCTAVPCSLSSWDTLHTLRLGSGYPSQMARFFLSQPRQGCSHCPLMFEGGWSSLPEPP